MLLDIYLLMQAGLIVFCIWLHRRGAPPLAPYLAVTAVLFVFAAAGLTLLWLAPGRFGGTTLSTAAQDGTYLDTYYVVLHTPMQIALLLYALLPLGLVWLQTHLRALYWPRIVRWLFWPLYLGLMVGTPLVAAWARSGLPRRYEGYEAHFALTAQAYAICATVALLALAALVLQGATGLVRRLILNHPPSA